MEAERKSKEKNETNSFFVTILNKIGKKYCAISAKGIGGVFVTKEEFEELILKNGKDIYSFCYYLTGSQEDADELYQDTMLHALEHCDKINKAINPKSFLISISAGIYRNNRKKFARRQRLAPVSNLEEQEQLSEIEEEKQPEQEYIKQELYQSVRREVASLPEKYKIPVYMHYTNGMTVEEIADSMRLSKGTVKSRLYRARQIMKKRLGDSYYGK